MSVIPTFVNYYDDSPSSETKTLKLYYDELSSLCDYINENNITHLHLCNRNDNDQFDLSILRTCPDITRIGIAGAVINFTQLSQLMNLELLSFDNSYQRESIDLAMLTRIKFLTIYAYGKNIKGISRLVNMKKMKLWKFNPKSRDLSDFNDMTLLEDLFLIQSSISSLSGLENMKQLRSLRLYYLRNLKSIDEIEHVSESLKEMEIDHCPKIGDFKSVARCHHLQRAVLPSLSMEMRSFLSSELASTYFNFK